MRPKHVTINSADSDILYDCNYTATQMSMTYAHTKMYSNTVIILFEHFSN